MTWTMRSHGLPRKEDSPRRPPSGPCARIGPALLALAGTAAAQGKVWQVGAPGSGDFTDIQSAVDAASDGDLIIVRGPAFLSRFEIVAKSLTLQAEGDVTVAEYLVFTGNPVKITGLGAGQSVVIRDFDFEIFGTEEGELIADLTGNLGPVIFEGCGFVNDGGVGLRGTDCRSLTLKDCIVDAGEFTSPRAGISVTNSNLWLYDSTVQGSRGVDAFDRVVIEQFPGDGGDGLVARLGSTVFLSGTSVAGGDGGSGIPEVCFAGGDGGDALDVRVNCTLRRIDSPATAGLGGLGSCGNPPGADGAELAGAGTVIDLPGLARSFSAGPPVTEGADLTLTYTGQPGDAVLLFIGTEPAPGIWLPSPRIALHLGPPLGRSLQGTVPLGGTLTVTFPAPLVGPGLEFARIPLQAMFVDPSLAFFHSGPSFATILAAGQ